MAAAVEEAPAPAPVFRLLLRLLLLSLPESLADPLALPESEEELLPLPLLLLLPRAELESADDELPLDVWADAPVANAFDLCDLCWDDDVVAAVAAAAAVVVDDNPLFEARLPAHGIAVDAVVGALGEPRGLTTLLAVVVLVVAVVVVAIVVLAVVVVVELVIAPLLSFFLGELCFTAAVDAAADATDCLRLVGDCEARPRACILPISCSSI